LEAARQQLQEIIEKFEGREVGGTGAETGMTGVDEENDESESGGTAAAGAELTAQTAEIERLKEQHALKENEWLNAREVMKKKLQIPTAVKMDVTDEEVEEAIEGSSILLHHSLGNLDKMDQISVDQISVDQRATNRSNVTDNQTSCLPLEPVDSTPAGSKCKMFTLSGKKCADDLDYQDAETLCKEHGARVCSHSDLIDAFKGGYESKIFGWTSTTLNGENGGHIIENIMQKDVGDMKKGFNVKEIEQNVNRKAFGVHCCGTAYVK